MSTSESIVDDAIQLIDEIHSHWVPTVAGPIVDVLYERQFEWEHVTCPEGCSHLIFEGPSYGLMIDAGYGEVYGMIWDFDPTQMVYYQSYPDVEQAKSDLLRLVKMISPGPRA